MKGKGSVVVVAGIIATTLILAVALPQRAFPTQDAQKPAPQPEVQVGRFQLVALQGCNRHLGKVFVVDTATGQVWEQIFADDNESKEDFRAPKLKKQ
jgi:hypothetical protein